MASTRILIVDDHPLFREALKQAVSGGVANAAVTLAGSLDAATQILDKDDEFDLILLDLRMPGVRAHLPPRPISECAGRAHHRGG
jgi:CheY-like chemotaxis protein